MKIDVIVEGNEEPGSSGAKPGQHVPANGQEDEGHVELESLGGPFGGGQAIAHDLECRSVPVLVEFPSKEADHGHNPQQYDPGPLPVLQQETPHRKTHPAHHIRGPEEAYILTPCYSARGAQLSAVVHVGVSL